eukprot:3930003-Rhodomonas_salina.3
MQRDPIVVSQQKREMHMMGEPDLAIKQSMRKGIMVVAKLSGSTTHSEKRKLIIVAMPLNLRNV